VATAQDMPRSNITMAQQTVVGIFADNGRAERALNGLKDAGFTPEQVSVVAKDKDRVESMSDNTDMVVEGAGSGAVAGTFLGGLAGFLVGISALVIPGIGPIVGAGIIASTLAGAGIGAATGGLIGALTAEGVHEEDARGYEENVRQGGILLSVRANGDAQAQQAHQVFQGAGGTDVRSYNRPS
jgi:uncharacterized membrane protein